MHTWSRSILLAVEFFKIRIRYRFVLPLLESNAMIIDIANGRIVASLGTAYQFVNCLHLVNEHEQRLRRSDSGRRREQGLSHIAQTPRPSPPEYPLVSEI